MKLFQKTNKKIKKTDKKIEILPKIKIKVFSADLTQVKIEKDYYIENTPVRVIIGEKEGLGVYFIQDPQLTKEQLELLEKTASELIYSEFKEDESFVKKQLEELGISPNFKYLILREIEKDRYSSLDPLMQDPNIESIECNGANVFLTVKYYGIGRLTTNLIYNEEELDQLVQRLAYKAGKSISKANPRIDNAQLPDGSRLAASYMSEISKSSTFVIKKFPRTGWTPTKLMKNNTLTPEIASMLWIFTENKMPILICGEMDSGKTSFANAICGFIKPTSRIATIEDVPEFKLPVRPESWLKHFTRESLTSDGKPITQKELLKQVLREVVDYVVVNEVRSEEDVPSWINAIASGSGGITTFHAANFEDLITRMEHLGIKKEELIALRGGIIFMRKISEMGKRRIIEIGQMILDDGKVKYEKIVSYNIHNDSYNIDRTKLINSKVVNYLSEKLGIKFEEELNKRIEYLKWLKEYAEINPYVLEPEGFLNEIKKYYNNPEYYKEYKKLEKFNHKELPLLKEKMESKLRIINIKSVFRKQLRIKNILKNLKGELKIKKVKKDKKKSWLHR